MKQEFLDSLKLAVSLDAIDFSRALFTSPSGFFIQVNQDKFAKIKGGHNLELVNLQDLISKPPVEYYMDGKEFLKTRSFAAGMRCGVNDVGKLFRVDVSDKGSVKNFSNALNDKGMIAFEVRSPEGKDISNLLAANIAKGRKMENERSQGNNMKM